MRVGPYEPRPIRFLGIAEAEGWRMKVYGIAAESERPPPAVVERAEEIAFPDLPSPAVAADRYGVGFLVVHEGLDGNYALLDWWSEENVLYNRVYVAPPGAPGEFEYAPAGPTACVWELRVLAFERDAWLETVLTDGADADFDAYLARTFEGVV